MARRLLLVSTSTVFGTGYLDHAEAALRALFSGVGRVLFVPWALHDLDAYADKARERFARMGLGLDSIHAALDPREAVETAKAIFIGGGNTFRLLRRLQDEGLVDAIRRRVEAGAPYAGTSAGSNVATASIHTTNDMPIVWPRTLDAFGLVPFNINPHYIAPDPNTTHMGETRDQRIREFHEEHDRPVLGLREGSMLMVDDASCRLAGSAGARVFERGKPAVDVEPGADLSAYL
ncbi:MAG: dipeptidase PepE [Planctomycetes bacterium]|nr:dipeptidase PepE [Planctomycetota bacterium]MCC7171358.1 dipeptidase PepE [Planctomycetota bacterium]